MSSAGEAASGDDAGDDARSMASGTTATATRSGPIRFSRINEDNVNEFLAMKLESLDLVVVMLKGKLGNQRHHAEKAAQKLASQNFRTESLKLKNRLKVFAFVESLHSSTIFALSETELAAAVNEVCQAAVIPVEVCKNLVVYKRNALLQRSLDARTINDLLNIVFPWLTSAGDAPPLRPYAPPIVLLGHPCKRQEDDVRDLDHQEAPRPRHP